MQNYVDSTGGKVRILSTEHEIKKKVINSVYIYILVYKIYISDLHTMCNSPVMWIQPGIIFWSQTLNLFTSQRLGFASMFYKNMVVKIGWFTLW